MKLFFKKTVAEQIMDLVDKHAYKIGGKEIDHILLTKKEASSLYDEMKPHLKYQSYLETVYGKVPEYLKHRNPDYKLHEIHNGYYMSVKLKVEGLDDAKE